jgi:hypothetical protein
MNPSKETTAAAPGVIPPRLVIKAVSGYADTFFTPLVLPECVPESPSTINTGSKSVPPDHQHGQKSCRKFRSPADAPA